MGYVATKDSKRGPRLLGPSRSKKRYHIYHKHRPSRSFQVDIIPNPSLGSGSPARSISDLFPTHEFEALNREASNQSQQPSRNVRQAVDHVLQDLKPSQRTHYKFCAVPRSSSMPDTGKSLADGLSPLTRTVYDKVGGFFKATKPNLPDHKLPNGQGTYQKSIQSNPSKHSPSVAQAKVLPAQNSQAHRSNSVRIEVAIPSKRHFDGSSYLDATSFGTPDVSGLAAEQKGQNVQQQKHHQEQKFQTPVPLPVQPAAKPSPSPLKSLADATKNASISIELPHANINREEYLEVENAPETPHNLSVRKGERQGYSGSQDLIGESLDQRQRGQAALDALDKLVRNVFGAVSNVLGMEPGYDHIVTTTIDQEVTMTAATQQKMHSAIQKTIGLNCYHQVPLDHLLQISRLSEGSLKQAEDLEMRIEDTWSEADVETWVQQLPLVDTALKAARTSLRILSGGREDKQLYSESVIQKSVDIFKNVTEDIVIRLVGLRGSGNSASVFKLLLKHRKAITSTFICCQKLFALLVELVTKIELLDTVINTLEFTATRLIFVENAYYDKDSVIGVQKFDGLRSVAMDMLCQIFIVRPQQRQGIFDEILTSLEKLPVGKQNARQFKLTEGKSIQPVSALIMRLVQASSGRFDNSKEENRTTMMRNLNGADGLPNGAANEDEQLPPSSKHFASTIKSEQHGAQQHLVAVRDLETAVVPLTDASIRNASYVINFIVTRAINCTKGGDLPFRNLLDLFVEDLTSCLDNPDWPSAELLLRLLMVMMVNSFEGAKTAAPAKNMALEFLGGMSAAISRLRSHVTKTAVSFEGGDSDELSKYLSDLAVHALEPDCRPEHLVAWAGPYRATLEYLQNRSVNDQHLTSAISFLVADWATRVHTAYEAFDDDENEHERDQELGRLAYRLRMMIEDRRWLVNEYTFKTVSLAQAKLSYSIILLRSPLCISFGKILSILLGSMTSDQATVRSKSLRSIQQVIETDPSILDGDSAVVKLIHECAADSSTQVRDSAISLIGNCIELRPALEEPLTPRIIERFSDNGVGVRKRAMKLATAIYVRNRNKPLRSAIANGLLRRVQDPDETVKELARTSIEDVWFAPFYKNEGTAVYETSLTEHVALIVQTVTSGAVNEILEKTLQSILKAQSKSTEQGPFSVCSKIVASLFSLIDNVDSDNPAVPCGRDALHVLTIFAKAEPKLFNFEQIRLLKPHLASCSSTEEQGAFRAVTVIYRLVLPQLSTVHTEFLTEVRTQFMKMMGKPHGRGTVDDLFACAKVVCVLLRSFGPIASAAASSLQVIEVKTRNGTVGNDLRPKFPAYCLIVGMAGKHFDLDNEMHIFKARFPKYQGDSVPKLLVDKLVPFTSPSHPLDVRKAALEGIGLVCQSWPRNYVLAKVYTSFQQAFDEQVPALESIILTSFKAFLLREEKRSEAAAEASSTETKKELTVMGGTTFDDVASATCQRFLKDIGRIAVESQGELAFLAMEVLGSINRQGLTHPKETGVTLITLETSANRKIAELAFAEHRSLHEKHETVLERDYARAVQSAYNYQRDVVKNSHGATMDPFQSKLHYLMEVLKISKMKNRQRFLEKLCGQVDFDLAKLDASQDVPEHVGFARFIIENLAFFEYQTVGELQTTVNSIEKMVASTGASVAQAIESEINNIRMDVEYSVEATKVDGEANGEPINGQAPVRPLSIDPKRLRQLTAGSVILLSLWEARTHLRRLYGMGNSRHDSKAKALAKDMNKTPVKVQGVHGERFWEEVESHIRGLAKQEEMVQKCTAFLELMSVDKEFKVADEEDQMELEDPATPSEARRPTGWRTEAASGRAVIRQEDVRNGRGRIHSRENGDVHASSRAWKAMLMAIWTETGFKGIKAYGTRHETQGIGKGNTTELGFAPVSSCRAAGDAGQRGSGSGSGSGSRQTDDDWRLELGTGIFSTRTQYNGEEAVEKMGRW
ncbi:hypothetical protein G7046_g2443 [Stylonectria norvegica]|nr:hypothetical protein G7046_g2443 [Stylonectria norvegica]